MSNYHSLTRCRLSSQNKPGWSSHQVKPESRSLSSSGMGVVPGLSEAHGICFRVPCSAVWNNRPHSSVDAPTSPRSYEGEQVSIQRSSKVSVKPKRDLQQLNRLGAATIDYHCPGLKTPPIPRAVFTNIRVRDFMVAIFQFGKFTG